MALGRYGSLILSEKSDRIQLPCRSSFSLVKYDFSKTMPAHHSRQSHLTHNPSSPTQTPQILFPIPFQTPSKKPAAYQRQEQKSPATAQLKTRPNQAVGIRIRQKALHQLTYLPESSVSANACANISLATPPANANTITIAASRSSTYLVILVQRLPHSLTYSHKHTHTQSLRITNKPIETATHTPLHSLPSLPQRSRARLRPSDEILSLAVIEISHLSHSHTRPQNGRRGDPASLKHTHPHTRKTV